MGITLKVQMVGVTKPPLWRRIRVPDDATLHDLHWAIQTAFGWEGTHLWCFHGAKRMYDGWRVEWPDDGDFWGWPGYHREAEERDDVMTPGNVYVKQFGPGWVFYYTYDFGDDWLHQIKVEANDDEPCERCRILASKGEDPQEDMGGVWGYLDRRANPEEWENREEW